MSDGRGGEHSKTIQIDADNGAPVPTIETPAPSKLFRVGESITLEGDATDPEDGHLGDGALTFEVRRHHDTHFHPYFPPTQGNDFTITAPEPEDISSTRNSLVDILTLPFDGSAPRYQEIHKQSRYDHQSAQSGRVKVPGTASRTPIRSRLDSGTLAVKP